MVVFGVVDLVAEFAPGLEAAVGCVVAELQASFTVGGGIFPDVFAEGAPFPEECQIGFVSSELVFDPVGGLYCHHDG